MKLNLPSLSKTASTPQMELSRRQESENTKWYKGDSPTRGETLAQIGRLYEQDQQSGLRAYKSFLTLSQDPSSAMYSPYMSATNNSTRQSFAQYGVDASNVNDAWFESNAWMKQYNRVGSTGNVLGTAKSATDAQNMASLYADLYDQEQTTKKAETEWAALQDEVRYWASRADLNMSDDEILAKVNWGNYPTLSKMDAAATSGAPVYTTRAVGYDKDLLKGVIYQTRNNGGSGDLLMDSAHYYSGMGNQYEADEAVRARFTYGSATYNPYVVSGTINDLGLYFGEGSFDRTWLEKNADILNGTNETAKKNYHKVQDAVALTEKANDELAKLNADIDRLVGMGVSADNIMGTIDRYLEEGTYPTLNKLQGSIETGELLNTASPINFDYASIRSMVDEKVSAKGATPEQANEAEGIDIVNHNGSDAEKAFFASMAALDYDEQVNQMWLGMESGELDGDYMARSYETLANSFNKKWASGAEDAIGGYAEYQDALHAQTEAIMTIERSDAYKRLKELGYTGEANDYQAINNFMNEQISDEDYEAVWESMHTMLADLAQAEYNADWVAENKYIGEEYKNDYSALEAFRRRAMVQGNLSIDPLLRNGEDYSIMDYAGVTADDMVSQVVAANEGVSSQEAAAHVATVYGDEKARLENEIATLEQSGYSGKTLDNKRNKLAAVERILGDVERNSVQNNADFAEKSAAGEAKIDTATLEPDSYNAKVTKDGNIAVSLMVYNHMTDEERARLHYYAETDPEQAIAYLGELTDDTYGVIPYRVHGTVSESAKKFAADHLVLATAASVITSPLQLAGTAYSVAQGLQGKELNPYSRFMAANAFVGQTRAQVAEDIDVATQDNPVLNFFSKAAYSAVTSGAESLLFGTAGKIGLPMMVSANMSSTVQNALQRGASTTEALLLGGASGLVEYATEKIPFDALTDAMKGGKAAAKGFKENFVRIVTDAAKTGSQDAAGEGLSEWAGNVADQLIMKDKSQHNIAVKTYLEEHEGATEEEAEKAVLKDEMMDVLSASVSGLISSGANVAAVETYNALTGNVEQEPAAETKRTADPRLARKTANLGAVALSGDNPSPSITAALTSKTDATSTIAKAVTLEAQRIFGDNTASTLSGIYGAAYDAGVSDAEITSALKKSLAPGNADGKVQLQELTQDGASTGKIKTFVQNMQNAPEFAHADAREVLINEQQRVIFEESTTFEGLHSAIKAQENAKNAYTKAQQVVGKIQKQQSASVAEMNKAMNAYNESLTNPNGNTQTAIQHAYMMAIDNVANFNSALEAANRRMQEAKAKYDAAISNYKEVGKRIFADVRAKAEKAVNQALMEAENKSVSELSSTAKPVTDTAVDGAPKKDDSEIRNAVIEEMRNAGLLDELTDVNREIDKLQKQIAGNRRNNEAAKPLQRMLKEKQRIQSALTQDVEALVAQEVARIETAQPETQAEVQPEASAKVMAESTGINRDADTATIPMTQKTQDTYTSDGDDYDALLEKYGAIEQGENPVNDMPVPKRVNDELKVMRGVRTAREAFTNEQLPAEVIKEIVVDERATYQADTNAKQIAWAQNQLAQGYDHAVGVWESAIEGGNIPNAKQIALGSMLVHEAVGRGDTAMAQKTIVELAEVETRAGQTVQASRILKKLGNNALLYYTVRAESEINRRLAKKGVHIAIDKAFADNLMKAKTEKEKMDATQAIINDLAAKLPRTWRDKANALAYLSMLSSPVTHIKNFAGNAANLPLAAIENAVGTAIDKLRPQDKRTHVLNIDKAYLDFAKKDYAETKDSDKGDRYKITAGAVYAARTPFADKGIGKALNKVSDAESKLLQAGDRVYKNMYYPRLMASYLQAQGVDLKNIPQNTLIKARKYADRKSKEYLYQDDSAAARWIQKGYEIPVFGEALRAVMPFAKTPINIAKRSMEFSVIGGVANIAYQGKKNGWGSNEVVEAISKSVAGGAMHVVGFLLANAGILVPSLGDDPEDQMAALTGSQAYALEIGGTSYTISWAGPAATEMLLGAEIAKAFDGKFTVDELVGSGLNLLNPLLDNTFLDGIVDLLSIGQYTQGGADLAGEVVAQLGSSYMAQYFPAALGAFARTIDATRRSTTTDPNSPIPESLQYQFAKMLNKIPFVSMTRPAWTDEFGQPDKTDGWLQRALENLVFPWYQNELKSDDIVLNEINKIYVATGGTDKALVPEMAAKSFSESNAKHKLGGDDYAKMNELHGKIQRDALEDLFSRPEWAEIDPYIKAEMIKDVYSYADNASRVDYVSTSPFSDSWQADAYKNGNIVDVVLGRAEKHAQSTWGKLYAAEVVGFALRDDWESATERAMEMTIAYPLGASLSMKQARTKIESELKTKLQEGDAEITPEEYDAVMQLYALGMIDSTLVDELMAQ